MPIKNIFGSAEAAAASIINSYNLVDYTDGSWTTKDTAGLLKTVAKDGDAMVLTQNTFTQSNNYYVGSTGSFTGWRAYKLATYSDGTPVYADDNFILTVAAKNLEPTLRASAYATFGIAKDGSNDTLNFLGHAGALFGFNGTGAGTTIAGSVCTGGFISGIDNQDAIKASQTTLSCVGDYYNGCAWITVTSAGIERGTGTRNNNYGGIGHNQLYLCGTFGTSANAAAGTDGRSIKNEIRYCFTKIEALPFA